MTIKADDSLYLRSEVRVEPLSFRWPAWTHLISPIQHSFNIAFRQLPLLDSFISETSLHLMAAKNPDLFCGPFVQLSEDDVPTVKALINQTLEAGARLIRLATDLNALEQHLQRHALGHSVAELYKTLPQSLSGLVEITYSLNNQPRIRIEEQLLETAGMGNEMAQGVTLSVDRALEMPFFLNTPRLDRDDNVFASVSFRSNVMEKLSKSRLRPTSVSRLIDLLKIPSTRESQFRSFFTEHEPIRNMPSYSGNGVRLRYFGHACVLVQSSKDSVLIDPCFSWTKSPDAPLTFADLPDFIDYVFITHNHPDHFCPEVLLQLRGRVGKILVPRNNPESIADPCMKNILRRLGFENVLVMDSLDYVAISEGSITSVPFFGEHSDLNIYSKNSMLLSIKGRQLLFLSDSTCLDNMLYRHLSPQIGRLNGVFIGMECHGAPLTWLYGPYITAPLSIDQDNSRRLSASDCKQATSVLDELAVERVFVYAMGQEAWLRNLVGLQYKFDSPQLVQSDQFVRICCSRGIQAERLYGCREFLL